MNFLPIHKETVVSQLAPNHLMQRLQRSTSPINPEFELSENTFQGMLEEDRFRISQQIKQPNNYVPLIEGVVEPTRHGSLVFITYKLFFSSFIFLAFWSVICLALAIFLALSIQNYVYAALALGLGALNYVITVLNFRKQVTISHDLLLDTLNID
jgi:hypothetical protein